MKRFRFKLQRVLDIKRIREEQRQLEVALAERRRAEAVEEVASLRRSLAQCERQLRSFSGASIPVERLALLSESAARLRQEIKQSETRVAAAVQGLGLAKAAHLEAVKERKSMERLRERRLAAFREELARAEQKEMDEMAQTVGTRGASREQ